MIRKILDNERGEFQLLELVFSYRNALSKWPNPSNWIKMNMIIRRKLSLSSNCIERLANMSSLKRLRILSLGRNNIKSISGLVISISNNFGFKWAWIDDLLLKEAVAETLEELWISYNQIEKLKGIGCMKKLRLLTMSNNNVREWLEFTRLADLTALKEVVFIGSLLTPSSIWGLFWVLSSWSTSNLWGYYEVLGRSHAHSGSTFIKFLNVVWNSLWVS